MRKDLDDDDDAFDANGICRDGRGIGVSTLLMDSRLTDEQARRFQPGYRSFADAGLPNPDPGASSEKARETYVRELQTAWNGQRWVADPDGFALAERLAPLLGLSRPIRQSSGPPFSYPRFDQPTRGSADDRRSARDQYVAKLRDAWRTPVGRDQELEGRDRATDPAKAVKREREIERWQGRPIEELAREVEAKRRKIHSDYTARLSSAWRGSR